MSLINRIFQEMGEDDEDWEDQGERLERIYDEASPEGKSLIDDVLICICGWSMGALRNI